MTESEQAKAWRLAAGLTRSQLADMTGYSREAVFLFERGQNSAGKPHDRSAWRRYKNACLAVRFLLHFKIGSIEQWEWQ